MAVYDDAFWAEVRQAYEANEEAVEAVAERFGITAGGIYVRARKERWPRRDPNWRMRRPTVDTLRTRATGVYDRLLERLERRVDAAADLVGEERDIKALKELTGVLDRLTELERLRRRVRDDDTAKGRGGGGKRASGDWDAVPGMGSTAFFAEVAGRLEVLLDGRPDDGAGDAGV